MRNGWTDPAFAFGGLWQSAPAHHYPMISLRILTSPKFLLAVDETTCKPHADRGARGKGDGMGDFHPLAWHHDYDGGRAFCTALGHLPAAYRDAHFLHHIYGGI